MLRYTTDRARPGLVALYDIWLGNGAGQFLQPRSPHGANVIMALRHNLQDIVDWKMSKSTKIALTRFGDYRDIMQGVL